MSAATMLVLKGQQLIMEMLLSTMPSALQEAWLDNFNEHNQEVVNLFKPTTDKPEDKAE
jgi:hypothetical protein